MSEDVRLPSGWAWASLGDIAAIQLGKMLSPKAFAPVLHQRPYLRNENVRWGYITFDDVKAMGFTEGELERFGVLPGDLLVCEGGEPGRCAVYRGAPGEYMYQKALHRVRTVEGTAVPQYLQFCLQHFASSSALLPRISQTTIQHLPLEKMQVIRVPLPPFAEQQRIVAAIEEQFTRLDAGVANLRRVRAALKRYRAAVLKAAVEGKLTEAWRVEHPDVEPASQLLDRILAERRSGWEADLRAKGKDPKNVRYEEYVRPATSDLPELPVRWCWATMDALLLEIQAGKNFRCDERPPRDYEVGVTKVSAVTWGEYDEVESKTCTDPARIDPELFVQPGDFLFSRANTIALVGACVIAKRVSTRVMLSDKILRLHFAANVENWVLLALRSRLGRDEIERLATGNQESMRNISQDGIRRIRVPLPPASECQQIVADVNRRLSVVDELDTAVGANLKRANRLRQAILQEAFAGRLVPQDPDDEPASVLLDRIRRERAAQVHANGRRRVATHGVVEPDDKTPKDIGDVNGEQLVEARAWQAGLWDRDK